MTYNIEPKLNLIDRYIAQLENIVSNNDNTGARELVNTIIDFLKPETHPIAYIRNDNKSYIECAKSLIAYLENYKCNIIANINISSNTHVNPTNSVNLNNNISTNVSITLESTLSIINDLPDNILSDKDKEDLSGKLATISTEKDKNKRWEKVGKALKWIAEKGIDVGIAVLPYIVEMIKK